MHEDVWAHQCRCGWSVRVPTLALLQLKAAEHRIEHNRADAAAEAARDALAVDVRQQQRDALHRALDQSTMRVTL